MTTGHFIAHLQFTFNGDINFNHFDNARRKLVTFTEAICFLLKNHFNGINLVTCGINNFRYLKFQVHSQGNIAQEFKGNGLKISFCDDLSFGQKFLASIFTQKNACGFLTHKNCL